MLGGVKRSIFTFSEHVHVAYQIKGNHECSNMVANILPAVPPPPDPGDGVNGKKEGKDQESIQSSTTPDPGKVTTSQFDITNESQEVSPFPASDHKALINRRAQKPDKNKR